ncbi:MAG: trypsin-like peptidase domain-containing protein [Opitutales bacterium]|nr:trypsin-like peptidase domain-containing protein [Opitutales bacterium]
MRPTNFITAICLALAPACAQALSLEFEAPKILEKDGADSPAAGQSAGFKSSIKRIKAALDEALNGGKAAKKDIDALTVGEINSLDADLRELADVLESYLKDTEDKLEKIAQYTNREYVSKFSPPKKVEASSQNSKADTTPKAMPVKIDGETFDASDGALIVDDENGGAASAFIANISNKNFVVTNFHVVSNETKLSFKTKDGISFGVPNKGFIAKDKDIYIIPINDIPKGACALPVAKNLEGVSAGDKIIVCGNGEGGGVLLKTAGKIVAIGPDKIEVDCPFYQGNSGSPLYHIKSGKIIGVISHVIIRDKDNIVSKHSNRFSNSAIKTSIRYFAQRIDSVQDWRALPLDEIAKEVAILKQYAKKLYTISYFEKNEALPSGAGYPDFEKIAIARISGANRAKYASAALKKKVLAEYCKSMSRLMSYEIASLKAKRLNPAFKETENRLIKEFSRRKADFETLLNSDTLN